MSTSTICSTVRLAFATLVAGTLWTSATAAPDAAPRQPLARDTSAAPNRDTKARIAGMLPPRTDSPADWQAGIEPLHYCGEPRLLPPCVPPPPCHPGSPPQPLDLIGKPGAPTCGPIYRGPCNPRTGTHDGESLPRMHRLHDRAFDWFYKTK